MLKLVINPFRVYEFEPASGIPHVPVSSPDGATAFDGKASPPSTQQPLVMFFTSVPPTFLNLTLAEPPVLPVFLSVSWSFPIPAVSHIDAHTLSDSGAYHAS